jgi:hypothetical protein
MSDSSFLTRYKQISGFPLLVLLLVCSTAICAGPMDQDGVVTLTLGWRTTTMALCKLWG